MASKYYHKVLSTNSSTQTNTPSTNNVSGYTTTFTVSANTDCQVYIYYRSAPQEAWTEHANYQVDTTVDTRTYTLTNYIRVGVINNGAGITDSVSVEMVAKSASPTYCTAADVAKKLNWISESDGVKSRFEFTASTLPTLAEVNELILEKEDYIDEATNHAWRARQIYKEYADVYPPRYRSSDDKANMCYAAKLSHRRIRPFLSGTDVIGVWDGSQFLDYVANKTEGADDDYFVDYTNGIIHFVDERPSRPNKAVETTYQYGETSVPEDIREAAILLTCVDLTLNQDMYANMPETSDVISRNQQKMDYWQKRVDKILSGRKEVVWL